ncbi:MAG: hypothetical protein JXA10_09840 [Anaerolineae bacterium]|nr:hypothetical protein [Anaerolineae bacterium]
MAIWTIADFELDDDHLVDLLVGVVDADSQGGNDCPLDAEMICDQIDPSRFPVEGGLRGEIQIIQILEEFFPILAQAGLAELLDAESETPQIILNDLSRQWYAKAQDDPDEARSQLIAWLTGEESDVVANDPEPDQDDNHAPDSGLDLEAEDEGGAETDDDQELDTPETDLLETDETNDQDNEDVWESERSGGSFSILGGAGDRTQQQDDADSGGPVGVSGRGAWTHKLSGLSGSRTLEEDQTENRSIEEPQGGRAESGAVEMSNNVSAANDDHRSTSEREVFAQGREAFPSVDPAISRLGYAPAASSPRQTQSERGQAPRIPDEDETKGPRGGGWLSRLTQKVGASKNPPRGWEDEPQSPRINRMEATPPDDDRPAYPRRLTNGPTDLSPRGPRALPQAPNTPQQTNPDHELAPLPLTLPDGSQMRIARRDLDRLIEEHGTLSNVITFLAEMQHKDRSWWNDEDDDNDE